MPNNFVKSILRCNAWCMTLWLAASCLMVSASDSAAADEYEANLGTVTRKAQAAAVKIYGAGGSGLDAYQSGFPGFAGWSHRYGLEHCAGR